MDAFQDETVSIYDPQDASRTGSLSQKLATSASARWGVLERVLLLVSLLIGAISHGYNLFLYPLYITDEGIYMEQAWSAVREGRLSPGSINKMLETLAAILEVGVEYGHLERNPARGRNRRLKASRPSRTSPSTSTRRSRSRPFLRRQMGYVRLLSLRQVCLRGLE